MKALSLILFALVVQASAAPTDYTRLNYKDIVVTKPALDEKHVRVWNIRKTDVIRINLVEFTGELPLHKHPDADHSLIVLEGKVRVQIAKDVFEVEKGDFISVPKDVPHKYWALSKKAMLVSMDAPYYDPGKVVKLE